ncbi:hypothetical protein AQUCO_00100012v1 [Aquilegia coerulea]|uniref:AAA+ ATPase domain-containing protein n=1 Tax=Aquilegia coerulea TaxID=218851 RepID=A0A2G5F8E9_AQUCA|nr:hypothetical protein AQUCO_00100012v1 [Aquilegia coerulea]
MAEALVSVVLEHLVNPAIEQVTEEVRLVRSVGNEIKSLVEELGKIKSLLEDAEKKQIHDKSVKAWFEELKDIAYDVDDVLDEWHTRILQQIATSDDSSTSKQNKKKVFACFSSPFNRSQSVLVRYRIAHRIKDLRQQLDANAKIIPGLHLIASQASHQHEDLPSRQIISSFVDPSKIHGRDHEKAEIMSWLRSQQEAKVSVMSVVGTPGFGKTALVQLVFHQENDKNTFDPTMWVCVSKPVDLQRLAKEIIESATGKKPEVDGLEALLRHLSDTVTGKMFMLILDDVWPKYLEHWWEQLKSSLDNGAQGSKIIITTRYQKVADVVESSCIILLRELQDEDCWSLFKRIAFSRRSANNHHNLEGIGEEIVKKCKGVPLAIKTIAGLMQYKQTIHEWESVRDSDVWEHVGEKLLPSLLLSYHAFPSYLKQCFMYCAVIPKDTLMKKDTLVKLWMAQGFLGSNGGKELETVGGAYFDELAMRSFFQDFEKDGDGSVVSCKIHDLVHDFAQSLTITECCVIQMNDKETCNSKVRHLTAPDTENPSISKLKELPKEVELLLHLRYLDLSRAKLTELPESLCKLYNLQTLKLDYCYDLCKLPNGIGELSNLRHFENKGTYELKYFPKGIERLSCLRTLNKFVVSGATGGCRIGELGNLIHLGGDLEIRGLWQVENMIEAKQAGLQEKKNLDSLLLDFDGGEFSSAEDREKMEGVLKGLQPHNNLKTLEIYKYPGLTIDWLCLDLRHLSFSYCENITSLPADLGKLQFLKSLTVKYVGEMKDVSFQLLKISGNGDSSSSSSSLELFPKLQFLKLINLRKWEEEEEENEKIDRFSIMPCLLELEIVFCPKLKVLPHYMMFSKTLRKLSIHNCPRLSGMKPCLPPLLEELSLWGDVGVLSSSLFPINNNSYPNLKSVTIIGSLEISSLPQGLNQFTSLQKLHLSYCESLDFKPEEEFRHLHTLPTLTITIYNCPLLKERSSRDDWANLSNFPKIIFQ